MLTRVKEMIDAIQSRPNASAGFTAQEVFEVGQTYGLTCREIYKTFLGKKNAIGYSRYLPQMPPAEVIEAALAAGPKKRGRKAGSTKKVVAKRVDKTVDAEPQFVEKDEQFDVQPNEDGEVFCWIATSQELSEEVEAQPVKKAKRVSKTKVS